MPAFDRQSRCVFVISPHLDDAVFGCGQLLAGRPGSTVLTVFAGPSPDPDGVTDWDASSGFASSREAMTERTREDMTALNVLSANGIQLPFTDAQYGPSAPVEEISEALMPHLASANVAAVLVPLGLFHSDHELASDAALACLRRLPGQRALAYEETTYRHIPGTRDERADRLATAGIALHRAGESSSPGFAQKVRAVSHYASQLKALARADPEGASGIFQPERYLRVLFGTPAS